MTLICKNNLNILKIKNNNIWKNVKKKYKIK